MLVVSRREGERLKVGDSIVFTIVRLGGDKVRIGVEAPHDVAIVREELPPIADKNTGDAIGVD